jgi:hypothetical protein
MLTMEMGIWCLTIAGLQKNNIRIHFTKVCQNMQLWKTSGKTKDDSNNMSKDK